MKRILAVMTILGLIIAISRQDMPVGDVGLAFAATVDSLCANPFVQAVLSEARTNPLTRAFFGTCIGVLVFAIATRYARLAALAWSLRTQAPNRGLRRQLHRCCTAGTGPFVDRLRQNLPDLHRDFFGEGRTGTLVAEFCTGLAPLMGLCCTLFSIVSGVSSFGGPAVAPTLAGAATCVIYVLLVELPTRHFDLSGRLARLADREAEEMT